MDFPQVDSFPGSTFRLPETSHACDENTMKLWEHHSEPLAPPHIFLGRLATQFLAALGIVAATLGIGVAGYMAISSLDFIDAFLESSMLLSGAGPLYTERSSPNSLKLFSSLYALFCTLVVVAVVGLLASPVVHRILHRLHAHHSGRS